MAGTGIQPAANGGEQEFDPSRMIGIIKRKALIKELAAAYHADVFPHLAYSPPKATVIGIIKRKALIKELAAAYHAECVTQCMELLQLQRKWEEEQHVEAKMPEELKVSSEKPSKRRKW